MTFRETLIALAMSYMVVFVVYRQKERNAWIREEIAYMRYDDGLRDAQNAEILHALSRPLRHGHRRKKR